MRYRITPKQFKLIEQFVDQSGNLADLDLSDVKEEQIQQNKKNVNVILNMFMEKVLADNSISARSMTSVNSENYERVTVYFKFKRLTGGEINGNLRIHNHEDKYMYIFELFEELDYEEMHFFKHSYGSKSLKQLLAEISYSSEEIADNILKHINA